MFTTDYYTDPTTHYALISGRWTDPTEPHQLHDRCVRCHHKGAVCGYVDNRLLCSACSPDADWPPVPHRLVRRVAEEMNLADRIAAGEVWADGTPVPKRPDSADATRIWSSGVTPQTTDRNAR